jgi:hypothetical protein
MWLDDSTAVQFRACDIEVGRIIRRIVFPGRCRPTPMPPLVIDINPLVKSYILLQISAKLKMNFCWYRIIERKFGKHKQLDNAYGYERIKPINQTFLRK